MKKMRIYIDTSVIGGCLDEEFSEESLALMDMVRAGEIFLLVSFLLLDELENAPDSVREVLESLPRENIEILTRDPLAEELRDKYLAAGVLGEASLADAHHVALATVQRAEMIVSWNFRHIVHYEKIRGFNAVNMLEGYSSIEIHSPKEVV